LKQNNKVRHKIC